MAFDSAVYAYHLAKFDQVTFADIRVRVKLRPYFSAFVG